MTRLTALALAALACLTACNRAQLAGPPDLHLGRDQCAECGMLLAEDRCAGVILAETAGTREHLVFDDVGCLLGYRAGHPNLAVIETFVRGYDNRGWLVASEAWFVSAGAAPTQTPMGSGIIALSTREAAKAHQAHTGGAISDYASLPGTPPLAGR